jgi:hypothetical protein
VAGIRRIVPYQANQPGSATEGAVSAESSSRGQVAGIRRIVPYQANQPGSATEGAGIRRIVVKGGR